MSSFHIRFIESHAALFRLQYNMSERFHECKKLKNVCTCSLIRPHPYLWIHILVYICENILIQEFSLLRLRIQILNGKEVAADNDKKHFAKV